MSTSLAEGVEVTQTEAKRWVCEAAAAKLELALSSDLFEVEAMSKKDHVRIEVAVRELVKELRRRAGIEG